MADFSMDEQERTRSTVTIERTASGKVTRKLRTVEGDSSEVVTSLVDRSVAGFIYLEAELKRMEVCE